MKRAHKRGATLIVCDPRTHRPVPLGRHPRPAPDRLRHRADQRADARDPRAGLGGRGVHRRAHRGLRGAPRDPSSATRSSGPARSAACPPSGSGRSHGCWARPKSAGVYYTLGITEHISAPPTSRRSPTSRCCWATWASRRRASTRCVARTTCRGPATSGRCPTSTRTTRRWTTPRSSAKFERAWGRPGLSTTPGLTIPSMMDGLEDGSLKSALRVRREHRDDRAQRRTASSGCWRALELVIVNDIFADRDHRLCRRRVSGHVMGRGGRHVHQHRATGPAGPQGASSRPAKPATTGGSSPSSSKRLGYDPGFT